MSEFLKSYQKRELGLKVCPMCFFKTTVNRFIIFYWFAFLIKKEMRSRTHLTQQNVFLPATCVFPFLTTNISNKKNSQWPLLTLGLIWPGRQLIRPVWHHYGNCGDQEGQPWLLVQGELCMWGNVKEDSLVHLCKVQIQVNGHTRPWLLEETCLTVIPVLGTNFLLEKLGVAGKLKMLLIFFDRYWLSFMQVAASANYRGVQWILGFAWCVSSQYGFTLTVQ